MSVLELALLAATGVFTAALSAVAGFGGGATLLAVLLLFMPPAAALPFHGAVQLVSNASRIWLFRNYVSWRLTWRFALLMPPGIWLGLEFFQGLSSQVIQIIIGSFILASLGMRRLERFRASELPDWSYAPLGLLMGVLNMVVGAVVPLLAALLNRRDLSKEQTVATLAMFAMLGHGMKILAFGLAGFDYLAYALPFAVMVPAVIAGAWLGKLLLGRFSERAFQILFQTLLILLSLKLIVWEGIVRNLL